MEVTKEFFGKTKDGIPVFRFIMKNSKGMEAAVLEYGCTLQELWVPDKEGNKVNVVLGYQCLEEYEENSDFLGACVGRFGGWIQNSEITVNGEKIKLNPTDGKNHLHGGIKGFDKYVWKGECRDHKILFSRISSDGEENYPGTMKLEISYELTEDGALGICYDAICDKDTVCNLTNHTYFNLNGRNSGNILGHSLEIKSQKVQSDNEEGISDWELLDVKNTPFDFSKEKRIGENIGEETPQLKYGHGYDHNYYLGGDKELRKVTTLFSDRTGIEMDVLTNQTGIQLYTGNYLSGEKFKENAGVCLETQYCPSEEQLKQGYLYPIVRAEERYRHETKYHFKIRGEK